MPTETEFIPLRDGDVGQSDFRFQCCDCGLIHRFEVDAAGRGVMRFYREDEEASDE